MFFKRFEPDDKLKDLIECYWIVEDSDASPRLQKIVPDGFPEIIFHFGNLYQINLSGDWEPQTSCLVGGQLRRHFFLKNTGASDMLGIKLKPTALTHLFGVSMHSLTDKVVDLLTLSALRPLWLHTDLLAQNTTARLAILNDTFKNLLNNGLPARTVIDRAVEMIFEQHGMMTVSSLTSAIGIGERQLENLFRKYVGVPPKFFMRIIRFNYIFKLVGENEQSWSSMAYEASFFDQSHFIRNFRNFTGENPSDYQFHERNMANFFLKKS